MSKKTRELEVQEVEASVESLEETMAEAKTYGREQLARSQKFKNYCDIVRSVVGEDEEVTVEELEKRVEDFLGMEVK